VSGVNAGILLKRPQEYAPDLTVGLSEKSFQACRFPGEEPLVTEFLRSRMTVLINRNPSEIRFLASRFDSEDIKYMKRMILIPATFRSQEAYLFLSFSGETETTLGAILSKLLVK